MRKLNWKKIVAGSTIVLFIPFLAVLSHPTNAPAYVPSVDFLDKE